MSLLHLNAFIREYGARENLALSQAPLVDLIGITLPKKPILHHSALSAEDRGFKADSLLAVNWPNRIRHSFIEEGVFKHGRVRRVQFSSGRYIKDYYANTPTVKRTRNIQRDLMDEKDMIVADYTLVPRMARYGETPTVYQDYWANMAETVVANMNLFSGTRPQFLQVHLGNAWQTEAVFKACLEEVQAQYRDAFRDPAMQWVLEIYRAMSGVDSIVGKIEADDVVFVITVGTKAVFLPVETLFYHADTDDRAAAKFHDLMEKLMLTLTVDEEEAAEMENETVTITESEARKLIPEGLQRQLEEKIEAGQLTQAQQRRYAEAIGNIAHIDSPFSDQPLQQYAKVSKEDITLDEDLKAPIGDNVVPEHGHTHHK